MSDDDQDHLDVDLEDGPEDSSRRSHIGKLLGLMGMALVPGTAACKPPPGSTTPDEGDASGEAIINNAQLYPTPDLAHITFPERSNPRYRKEVGVAISGGSTRSFSAAIGQLSALRALGLLPEVGTLSTLSGSSWFGSLFNYMDSNISDETMLGEHTMTPPGSLKLEPLETMAESFIGYPIQDLRDGELIEAIVQLREDGFPLNRLFSGSLGKILLAHFGLFDPTQYFSVDEASVAAIVAGNPHLGVEDFVTMRADRPYWIASSSAVNIHERPRYMYHFEYSPLYCGTAQTGKGIGGGYVQSIGFNTSNPKALGPEGLAQIPAPSHAFALFDLMGSSGAAPGIVLDKLGIPELLPEFEYWPVYAPMGTKAELWSFADGGDLEDTAIVALLRRQLPTVIAFVNSESPLGAEGRNCVDGLNSNITRLFGRRPPEKIINDQDTQVFDNSPEGAGPTPLEALIAGFHETKEAGGVPHHLGTYRIMDGNAFGLEPYSVEVLWVYNDLDTTWAQQLPDELQRLLDKSSRGPLHGFPNYKTVFQDPLQMFLLEPLQVQLLANMWHFSLTQSASLRSKLEGLLD